MRFTVLEFDDLVLDRRTISRTSALDPSGVKRRLMKISLDNLVGFAGRVRYPAGHLFHVERACRDLIQGEQAASVVGRLREEGESERWVVALLNLALFEVDRATIQAAGGSSFESP